MSTAAERVAALVAAFTAGDRSFDIPGTLLSVSVTRDPVADGKDLVVWLTITRAGVIVPLNNPFIFRNPPDRLPGDLVARPRLALLRMLRDTIEQVAAWRQ
jgi:hypothetical protein